MAIECCHYCVAPKRHTACWGHCPEYIAEKEQFEKEKEQEKLKRKVSRDIHRQRLYMATKALRRHGRKC